MYFNKNERTWDILPWNWVMLMQTFPIWQRVVPKLITTSLVFLSKVLVLLVFDENLYKLFALFSLGWLFSLYPNKPQRKIHICSTRFFCWLPRPQYSYGNHVERCHNCRCSSPINWWKWSVCLPFHRTNISILAAFNESCPWPQTSEHCHE